MTSEAIRRGLEAQHRHLRERLSAGMPRLGWKIAINDPAMQRRLGIEGPLVGYLRGDASVAPGSVYRLGPGARGAAEVEIALRIGRDVAAGAEPGVARAAIASLAPAIEVVDYSLPSEPLAALVEHDFFHRAVVLGDAVRAGAGLEGVAPRVLRGGAEEERGDLGLIPGDLGDLVRLVAETLAPLGDGVRAGDVIISGALTRPLRVAPGDRIAADLGALGSVEVRFA